MIVYTPDVPTTEFTPSKNSPKAHLQPLDTPEIFFKLEEVLALESLPTANNLRKYLQHHNLSEPPLL